MMYCECRDCHGDKDSLEPCINAQMQAEFSYMKKQMNLIGFWPAFFVIMSILLIAQLFL